MESEPVQETYLRALHELAESSSTDVAFQAAALTIAFLLESSSRGFHRAADLPFIVPDAGMPEPPSTNREA